jgi:hypothetical protein
MNNNGGLLAVACVSSFLVASRWLFLCWLSRFWNKCVPRRAGTISGASALDSEIVDLQNQFRSTLRDYNVSKSNLDKYQLTTISRRLIGTSALFSKLKYKSVDGDDFDLIDTTAVGAASVEATKKRKNGKVVVTNVQELREEILCQGSLLSEIDLQIDYSLPLNEHTNSNSSTDANNATPLQS